jgi:hypothetical protein
MSICPHACLAGKDNATRRQRIVAPILLVTVSGAGLTAEK